MAGSVIRMLSPRLYSIPRGSGAGEFKDFETGALLVPLRSMGDITAEFDFQATDADIRSSEDPYRRLVDAPTVQADGTVKGKFRQFDRVLAALAYQAQPGETMAQAAGTGSCTFNNITAGQILRITDANGNPVFNLASVTVTGTDWTTDNGPVQGNYKPILGAGRIEVRDPPAGITTMTVNWTSNAGTNVGIIRPLSQVNFEGSFEFYQKNVRGVNRVFIFPRMKLKITKMPAIISDSNEPVEAEFEGKILLDPSQAPGFEYGQIIEYDPNA